MQFTNRQLPELAHALIERAARIDEGGDRDRAAVIALAGDLGVGKTTLVQEMAKELQVERLVPSPTFVIMRSYPTVHSRFKRLVHIDAYRIESPEELAPLKLEGIFSDPEALVCVEWPERLFDALPQERIEVRLAIVGEYARELISDPAVEDALQKALDVV